MTCSKQVCIGESIALIQYADIWAVDTVADFNGIPPMSQVNQQAAFQSEFQFWENETAVSHYFAI